MIVMGRDTKHFGCGCTTVGPERWGEDKEYFISYPCFDCQQKMIGTRTTVVRYGDMPKGGRSYNYRENKYEDGVSVYLETMRPRAEFTDRPKRIFSAVIIGWGGDDEPLIDANTIKEG